MPVAALVVGSLGHPRFDRDEHCGRVGVAAGAGHPYVARAQLRLDAVQHGQFPVVPVGGSAAVAVGLVEVPAPAGRHERRRLLRGGLLRDGRSGGSVQFPQHFDRGQQRVDVRVGGVAGQWQVPDDGRGEGAQVLVTGGKQVEMAVITRIPLGHWAARGLKARHPDARTDQPPGVCVGHERVGENVEYLVQQPSAGDLDTCSFHDPLRQLVPGARIGPGQRLIQELHELVEDLDVGLGQRRQQDGISPVAIGALQRLVG